MTCCEVQKLCLDYNHKAALLNSRLQAYIAPHAMVDVDDTDTVFPYTIYMYVDNDWLYFAGSMTASDCADRLGTLISSLDLMAYQAIPVIDRV